MRQEWYTLTEFMLTFCKINVWTQPNQDLTVINLTNEKEHLKSKQKRQVGICNLSISLLLA